MTPCRYRVWWWIVAGLVWLAAPGPAPAAVPPALRDLTPPVRERIDRLAKDTAPETLAQEKIDFGGNVVAWAISQTTLSPEEELQSAREIDRKIRAKYRVLETPPEVEAVFRKLVDALPPHLRPDCFRYTLTILDLPEPNAFTVGAGLIYVGRPLLEALLTGGERGRAALAYVLGHELGHTAYLHCRRGYQRLEIEGELKDNIRQKVEPGLLNKVLRTGVNPAGHLVTFLYSRDQEYEADLFALHLCRNAGFDLDQALDAARYLVVLMYPRILTAADFHPREGPSSVLYYLSSHPDPLRRLRRLHMELGGLVGDERQFGLFAYDRETGKQVRCGPGSVSGAKPVVVFVHGMRGGQDSLEVFRRFLEGREEARGLELLVFRYPNNQSLARSGQFLHNEVARVLPAPRKVVFVCHSAGGLVFRYYAEAKKGEFDRAFFLGTPHQGSALTALKFLVDVEEFLGAGTLGLPEAIAQTVPEGRGEIVHDLHPDSLFLRYLGRDAGLARRYHMVAGEYLGKAGVFALEKALPLAKRSLQRRVEKIESPLLRRRAAQLIEDLALPEEITRGDLVVSVASASLKDAGGLTVRKRLHHQQLKADPEVMGWVLREVLGK